MAAIGRSMQTAIWDLASSARLLFNCKPRDVTGSLTGQCSRWSVSKRNYFTSLLIPWCIRTTVTASRAAAAHRRPKDSALRSRISTLELSLLHNRKRHSVMFRPESRIPVAALAGSRGTMPCLRSASSAGRKWKGNDPKCRYVAAVSSKFRESRRCWSLRTSTQ